MNALIRAAAGVQALCVANDEAFARSSFFTYPPDVPLRTCSAEDLVVFKASADRPKDWVDVEDMRHPDALPRGRS